MMEPTYLIHFSTINQGNQAEQNITQYFLVKADYISKRSSRLRAPDWAPPPSVGPPTESFST